ncbi:MAG: hypothetical protein J2P36_02700 [Ktedonobacteraceae bacterium]|nr:hypothetical protein [Ktedonobacteraceae bacterium]
MTATEMRVDLSTLVDAIVSGDTSRMIATARTHLLEGEAADVLIGRIGMIAAHGDADGHVITTLAAAAMLCRYLRFIPDPLNPESSAVATERALPLFVHALLAAAPAVHAGFRAEERYPEPLFPSELLDSGKTVSDVMKAAVEQNDVLLVERLILGLYGTGADYRTMEVRTYDGITTTFQAGGHPLIFAVRGFQLLEAVEWGDRAPHIIHWLAPHLPLQPNNDEPEWVHVVRAYVADPAHDVTGIRKRLAAPKDEQALPLRQLILSDTDTASVCQGVYDALMKNGASPRGISSVIALAAADIALRASENDSATFTQAAHGLLFASAASLALRQVQDVDALPLIFTAAAYVNAQHKEIAQPAAPAAPSATTSRAAGGLIGASQLEALSAQLKSRDFSGALSTTQRYLGLRHDPRPLFGTIGLAAAQTEMDGTQEHILQIVLAASEEFLAWPRDLANVNIDAFLKVALRAALTGGRNEAIELL